MNEISPESNELQNETETGTGNETSNPVDAGPDDTEAGQPAWAEGLSDENRKLAEANGWADPDALNVDRALDAYRDLELKSSGAVTVPGEDATPEERDAFERHIGRPESPDGYAFNLPDGLPDDFPYSEDMADRFRDWAFRAGVPARAAQSLHDDYVREIAGLQETETQRIVTAEEQSHRDLTDEWGGADSDAYRRNVLLADRAATGLGLGDVLREYGLMGPDGGVRDARIAVALARVGAELFAEDSLYGAAGGEANPFSGDNPNLTEQSRLIREARQDPGRAAHVRALMQAAGVDPEKLSL